MQRGQTLVAREACRSVIYWHPRVVVVNDLYCSGCFVRTQTYTDSYAGILSPYTAFIPLQPRKVLSGAARKLVVLSEAASDRKYSISLSNQPVPLVNTGGSEIEWVAH